jgi:threonyl-tRNA synthetase
VPSTGQAQGLQADQGGRRLLARRFAQRDAAAHLRHRLADRKALKAYLHRIEEAEKRDHRRIGKKLRLFHTQEEAPGMVFWHPRGWTVYQAVEQYMRAKLSGAATRKSAPRRWSISACGSVGPRRQVRGKHVRTEKRDRDFAVKPMNCPCHVQIFNQGLKSYRDLPLRLAEFGSCHRNEPSGSLHGLMRVRGFTQDDAHIFCTEAQIQSEVLHTSSICCTRSTPISASRRDLSCRHARRIASAATRSGTRPSRRWPMR